MAAHGNPEPQVQRRLEVGYVLFMDLVGYSRLIIEEQHRTIEELQKVVRELDEFRAASEENRLIRLPTGDGMALVFFGDPEAPLRAAVELSRALRNHPTLKLRMGIHTGPVYRVEDINANMNVAGGGVNLAQRVMDCGDAGHILVSEDSARFFAQVGEWADRLHDLGRTRVKHGVRLHLYSLFVSEIGNPGLPRKLRRERLRRRVIGGAVLLAVVVSLVVLLWPPPPPPPARKPVHTQVTTNPAKRPLNAAAISPNGQYLAYVDARGIFVRDIKTGVDRPLPTPDGTTFFFSSPNWALAWFPDSNRLLVSGLAGEGKIESLWLFYSSVGPAPQQIREKARSPAVAPDGSQIAFIDAETQRSIWLVGPQGENPRRILPAPQGNTFDSICWSPKVGRLAFLEIAPDPENDFIGTVNVDAPANQTTVVRGKYLLSGPQEEFSGLSWLPGDRIVYVTSNPPGPKGSNLWAIPVDSKSGQATGSAAQITSEADVYQSDLSSTSDGTHVAFLRTRLHSAIYLGHLDSAGRPLTGVEEFISEESNNWANSWTPDSKFLLFTSDRKRGVRDIFRQAAVNGRPEALAASGDIQSYVVALSNGTSYLYWSWPKDQGDYPEKKTLKQLAIAGGPPVNVLDSQAGKSGFGCALAAPVCLISKELNDGLDFSQLDIQARTEKLVAQLKLAVTDGYDWDLSPDGRSLAVVHSGPSDNVVRFVTLADGTIHQVPVPGWSQFEYVAWAADGSGVYLAANMPKNSALLRLELNGKLGVLWRKNEPDYVELPVPSPDGKHIAFTVGSAAESNAWIVEQF